MNQSPKEILIEVIKELLSKMDFEGRIDADDSQPDILVVNVESDEAGWLIGQGGENLGALQHLARAVVNKKLGQETLDFIMDVNSYRAHRVALLKEMALGLAKQAAEDKQPKVLEPMPPYERRIVHLALKNFEGIETESQDEGLARRIVIKPSSNAG